MIIAMISNSFTHFPFPDWIRWKTLTASSRTDNGPGSHLQQLETSHTAVHILFLKTTRNTCAMKMVKDKILVRIYDLVISTSRLALAVALAVHFLSHTGLNS